MIFKAILILCFLCFSTNLSLATEVFETPSVIVQEPPDLSAVNLQMLMLDRINQEQVVAIEALLKKNRELAEAALAHQQNPVFETVDKTIANSQQVSKDDELINLNENADHTQDSAEDPLVKMDFLQGKYQILIDLKNEMMTLNHKLQAEVDNENITNANSQQDDQLQLLTQRLADMDQRINHYDEIIIQKDKQLAQLAQIIKEQDTDLKAKDDTIHWLNQVLAATKNKAAYYQFMAQQAEVNQLDQQVAQNQTKLDLLKSELENKITELGQKNEQISLLKDELENKITQEKDQNALTNQVKDLKVQLRDKEGQIAAMKVNIQATQEKAEQLQQQLDNKTAEADKTNKLLDEYQEKLESKDNAYNQQLGQVLSSNNDEARMSKQITDLSLRLQQKEAEVIKIKQQMYDLQKSSDAKEVESQAKDLSLSIMQQEIARLKNLAVVPQQSTGTANSDEIDFLKAGFQKATAQLKQKDQMILEIKANADEYQRKYKQQSLDFQSLKDQLHDARQEMGRFKGLPYKGELQVQLKKANAEIKDLQDQLNQLRSPSTHDALAVKLAQALDKIVEQGEVINTLSQKLQDCNKP